MAVAEPRLTDGVTSVEGGIDAGLNPSIIRPNQLAYGVNVTARGAFTETRPPFDQITLVFGNVDDQALFEDFPMQAAQVYVGRFETRYIIAMVGGKVFRIDPTNQSGSQNVVNITPDGGNATNLSQGWMCQAEQYLVIQDGWSIPLIYDGSQLRRSRPFAPFYEVPPGTAMEYGLGRLVVVKPNGREYVLGDLVNNGTTQVIQFTENNVLAEGGAITVPIPGQITAVKIIAQLDRSIGQGDLTIHTTEGVATAKIGEKRSTWKDIEFQATALLKWGATSQAGTVLVNGDMFFRASDGWRSLAMARRDFNASWATTPISREMNRVLQYDDLRLLGFSQAILFDNRLLATVWQAQYRDRVYHRALAVLDFDLVSSISGKLPPVWDGIWTGLNPTVMCSGDFKTGERCFVFHLNEDKENELWEVKRSGINDNGEDRIPWYFETRSMSFNKPHALKSLKGGDLHVDNITGTVDFDVKFRADQDPLWRDWHSWSVCATYIDCDPDAEGCQVITQRHPQYRSRMFLPLPDSECDDSDEKPTTLGYEFQVRMAGTGKARIKALRAHCDEKQEKARGCVESEETCRSVSGCNPNPNSYRVS